MKTWASVGEPIGYALLALMLCAYSFLARGHRPSQFANRVGTPQSPVQRRQYGGSSRGCSQSPMFTPPGLLATQVVPTTA